MIMVEAEEEEEEDRGMAVMDLSVTLGRADPVTIAAVEETTVAVRRGSGEATKVPLAAATGRNVPVAVRKLLSWRHCVLLQMALFRKDTDMNFVVERAISQRKRKGNTEVAKKKERKASMLE